MGRPRKQRRQPHGSAWHWKQTDCWYYTLPGTKKRMPLLDEHGQRIRGRQNQEAAEMALARAQLSEDGDASGDSPAGAQRWRVAKVCSEYLQYCDRGVANNTIRKGHRDNATTWLNDYAQFNQPRYIDDRSGSRLMSSGTPHGQGRRSLRDGVEVAGHSEGRAGRLLLSIASATIDGGLERGQHEGRALVLAVRRTEQPSRGGKATFTAHIPQAGDYAIWFYNRSRRTGVSTFAAVDQTTNSMIVNGYVDRLFFPGHGPEKAAPWLVQRLVLRPRTSTSPSPSRDVFPLAAGQHTIALGIGLTDANGFSNEFGDVIITNDLTWTPDDYDARRLFDLGK